VRPSRLVASFIESIGAGGRGVLYPFSVGFEIMLDRFFRRTSLRGY
jgi:hypothetical protein